MTKLAEQGGDLTPMVGLVVKQVEQDILDAETTGSLVDHRAIADDPVETLFRQLRYPTRDAPVFPVALPPQFREIC